MSMKSRSSEVSSGIPPESDTELSSAASAESTPATARENILMFLKLLAIGIVVLALILLIDQGVN